MSRNHSGKRSGKIWGIMLGYASGSDSGEVSSNTLRYDSGKQHR
jgi:hypothetical protein